MRFLLLIIVLLAGLESHAMDEGFGFRLSGQTLESHGAVISEREGSRTYTGYVGYGLAFYRERADILRLNLGLQPIKGQTSATETSVTFIYEASFSFMFAPDFLGPFELEARLGPQYWEEQDKFQIYRALGLRWKYGTLFGLPVAFKMLLGMSDDDDLMYTQLRAGLDITL